MVVPVRPSYVFDLGPIVVDDDHLWFELFDMRYAEAEIPVGVAVIASWEVRNGEDRVDLGGRKNALQTDAVRVLCVLLKVHSADKEAAAGIFGKCSQGRLQRF